MAQYYAHYVENGDGDLELKGYFASDVHQTVVEPNIELTYEEWQAALAINANRIENGKPARTEPPRSPKATANLLYSVSTGYLDVTRHYLDAQIELGVPMPVSIADTRIKAHELLVSLMEDSPDIWMEISEALVTFDWEFLSSIELTDQWILATGRWNDEGIWDDTAQWKTV